MEHWEITYEYKDNQKLSYLILLNIKYLEKILFQIVNIERILRKFFIIV